MNARAGIETRRPGRRRGVTAAFAVVALLGAGTASAGTGVTAIADRTQLALGERVEIRVDIEQPAGGAGGDVKAPDLTDWQIVGRSQSMRSDGFSGRRTTTLVLTMRPKKSGILRVGAFELNAGGKVYASEPIVFQVNGKAGGSATPPSSPPSSRTSPPASGLPDDAPPDPDVFLEWQVDKRSAWLGEPLTAQLYIYVNRRRSVSQVSASDVNLDGFWNQPREQRNSQAESIILGGERFVRERMAEYVLFPLRAGVLKLPAVAADMVVAERVGFFGNGRRQRARRLAEPVEIQVKPLPSQGRPKHFRGPAVGRVTLNASVDRREIRPDEGVQLTVRARIAGLLQNLPKLELESSKALADFRVFPPTHKEQQQANATPPFGSRQSTWLLKPLKKGNLTIPALEVSYFDPSTGRYARARTLPLRIRVQGEARPNTAVDTSPAARAGTEDSGPKLRTVRTNASFGDEGRPAYRSPLFFAVLAGAPLLLLGLFLGDRLSGLRATSARSRAVRDAGRTAKSVLDGLASAAAPQAFAGVAQAVLAYLETRFDEPFGARTHRAIAARLEALGVSKAVTDDLVRELENCDFARYAPEAVRDSERRDAIDRAKRIVDRIEEAVS